MKPRLCDSHCHLDVDVFDKRRSSILLRAKQVGVEAIVVPGIRASDWENLLALCHQFHLSTAESPALVPALGLHPCFISDHQLQDLSELKRLLQQFRPVAVGEIGLDFWSPEADQDAQLKLLRSQLELAQQFRLPVLLHARKCHDQLLQQLRQMDFAQGGIVHAFSGSRQQAEQYLNLGFKLGIGGSVTYPRAKRLRRIVQELGSKAWVLETDAPDMPLCGKQGEPNMPFYLPEVLRVMSELLELSESVLAEQCWQNTLSVLPDLKP